MWGVGGGAVRALVDTGCMTKMVRFSLVRERVGESWMSAFDGRKVRCGGERPMNLEVGGTPVEVSAVAIEHLVGDLDVVFGMDVIEQLGGVMVRNDGVDFGVGRCLTARNEGYRAVTEREGPGGPQRVEDLAGHCTGMMARLKRLQRFAQSRIRISGPSLMERPGRLPISLRRIRARSSRIKLVATSESCQAVRKRSLRGR